MPPIKARVRRMGMRGTSAIESISMRANLVTIVAAVGVLAAQPARTPISLVVIGKTVVTQDVRRQALSPGAVAINGNTIVDVDAPNTIAVKYRAGETINARDEIVLPGLVNTHTHAPMVMYRGLADDLALMEWLNKYIFPAEAKTVSP